MNRAAVCALVLAGCSGGLGDAPRVPVVTSGATSMDVNDDGFADVVTLTGFGQPTISLHNGSPTGFTLNGRALVPNTYYNEGATVWIGDVNGDGFADVAVYDRFVSDDPRVHILYGGADGLRLLLDDDRVELPLDGEVSGPFSQRVIRAGDLDGDGIDDLVIWRASASDVANAHLLLYRGGQGPFSVNGVTRAPDRLLRVNEVAGWPAYQLDPNTQVQSLSTPVGGADLNDDGFGDLFFPYDPTFAYFYGDVVPVLFGDAAFALTTGTTLDTLLQAPEPRGVGRWDVADVNGDGALDLLEGDDRAVGGASSAVFWLHHSTQPGKRTQKIGVNPPDDRLGVSLRMVPLSTIAGDVNADGYADALVVAPGSFNSSVDELRTDDPDAEAGVWIAGKLVYYGQPDGIQLDPLQIQPPSSTLQVDPAMFSNTWGLNAASLGDINGDGFDDVGVADNLGWSLFYGSNRGLSVDADAYLMEQLPVARPAFRGPLR